MSNFPQNSKIIWNPNHYDAKEIYIKAKLILGFIGNGGTTTSKR
jgi:hypothetical protein